MTPVPNSGIFGDSPNLDLSGLNALGSGLSLNFNPNTLNSSLLAPKSFSSGLSFSNPAGNTFGMYNNVGADIGSIPIYGGGGGEASFMGDWFGKDGFFGANGYGQGLGNALGLASGIFSLGQQLGLFGGNKQLKLEKKKLDAQIQGMNANLANQRRLANNALGASVAGLDISDKSKENLKNMALKEQVIKV